MIDAAIQIAIGAYTTAFGFGKAGAALHTVFEKNYGAAGAARMSKAARVIGPLLLVIGGALLVVDLRRN